MPLVANYYVGSPNHKLQLGLGGVFYDREGVGVTSKEVFGTLVVGYRYLPYDGGLNFGVAFTPFFGHGVVLAPSGGLSLGYGF